MLQRQGRPVGCVPAGRRTQPPTALREAGEPQAGGRGHSSRLLPPRRCLTGHKLLTFAALKFRICQVAVRRALPLCPRWPSLPVGAVWELRSRGCGRFWLTRQLGSGFTPHEPRPIWAAAEPPWVGGCRWCFLGHSRVCPSCTSPSSSGACSCPHLTGQESEGCNDSPEGLALG